MARSATANIKRSADYVTVACKLPQGLIIPVQGLQNPIKLHGTHSPFARFGFGMTEIKAEIWDAINKQYGEREGINRHGEKCMLPKALWLENRVVFAASDTRSVNAEAKERETARVGFEPVDPKKPNELPGAGRIQVEGDDDLGMGT